MKFWGFMVSLLVLGAVLGGFEVCFGNGCFVHKSLMGRAAIYFTLGYLVTVVILARINWVVSERNSQKEHNKGE